MTAKSGAEKEKKLVQHQESLKGALVGVLAKNDTAPVPATPPPPTPVIPIHAPVPPPHQVPSIAPVPPATEIKKPFEVPEDALRRVLKGDI